jgi:hypothetical protein
VPASPPIIGTYTAPAVKRARSSDESRQVKAPKRYQRQDKATAARDKWIYARCVAGVPYSTIIAELMVNTQGWRPIVSGQGVHSAALRHAERHDQPKPAVRPPPGRRARTPGG